MWRNTGKAGVVALIDDGVTVAQIDYNKKTITINLFDGDLDMPELMKDVETYCDALTERGAIQYIVDEEADDDPK